MSRSRSLLLAGALVAGALVPAAAAGAAPADRAADAARAEHERILAYWTPERMRAAIPRDFVRQSDGSFRLATPKAKPDGSAGKGKPGGSTSPTFPVDGASGEAWTAAGEVQARTGKVYFRMGASGYVCSGSVVDDELRDASVILTAAHCAYDWRRGFATDWLFIPDFDANPNLNTKDCSVATTTYGCWTARALVVHSGFVSARRFNTQATTYDFAFAVVGAGGKGGSAYLDDVVGSFGRTRFVSGSAVDAFGYPAGDPYGGSDLIHCAADTFEDPLNGKFTWGIPCDMTGGSSGGPWLTGSHDAIGSLNSYGYSGYDYMFGPKFGDATEATYSAAVAGPSGNTVVN